MYISPRACTANLQKLGLTMVFLRLASGMPPCFLKTPVNFLASCRRIWTKMCQNEALALPTFLNQFLQAKSKEKTRKALEETIVEKTKNPKLLIYIVQI